MERILVATDFSERSDRALERAVLTATRMNARLHLVHAVDDDRKQRIVESETALAEQLLQEEVQRLKAGGGPVCTGEVVLGDPFEGICNAADAAKPALVVLGAHRRQVLRDVFIGTTAQRTIRRARWPVLMVNADPERAYASVVFATDLSDSSRRAFTRLDDMGLIAPSDVTLLHMVEAPAQHLSMRNVIEESRMGRYLYELRLEAEQALAEFAARLPPGDRDMAVRHHETSTSMGILDTANELVADLIVVASKGRAGLTRTLMGSVAEEVLRRAGRDVMVIPHAAVP